MHALRGSLISSVAFVTVATLAAPVQATFPGGNGQIVFVSERDGNSEIYIMDPSGTGQTNLTNNPATDFPGGFSPDGRKLAFDSDRDGNPEIYSMNVNGTAVTRLTNNPTSDSGPSYSPDESKIAFTSERDGNPEIYVMKADGTAATRLTTDSGIDFAPVFSPNGRKIVFTSSRDGNLEIYSMRADGSSQTNLTASTGDDFVADWAPNGKKLVFVSFRTGDLEIFQMKPDGTSVTNLTSNPAEDRAPAFSPDGTRILFVSDRGGNADIWSMPAGATFSPRSFAASGDAIQITTDPADDSSPVEQPLTADLSVFGTKSGPRLPPGGRREFELDITNKGPAAAIDAQTVFFNLKRTDKGRISELVKTVTASASAGSCEDFEVFDRGQVTGSTCHFGTMAKGDVVTVTVVIRAKRIGSSANNELRLELRAESRTPDPLMDNNEDWSLIRVMDHAGRESP